MDKPRVTPKDFFLWVGAMIALYASVFALLALFFDYINYAFPDALNFYIDPYSGSIRYEMASLIVLSPLFLVLMRLIRKDIQHDHQKRDLWIRRWALYLTVFLAGATVAGDLITLINYFLGGEVTIRFLLKVLVVFLVAGAGFLHFLADIWGYWIKYPGRAQMVGWSAGVLVLASIFGGFVIMGSPSQVRMYRFDDQKVQDLTSIQYQIVNYWQQKQVLPGSFADLKDPIGGYSLPVDPQTGESYGYEATGKFSFRLCADFNAPTQSNSISARTYPKMPISDTYGNDLANESWNHDAGEKCFDRTIDPERYPPYTKTR